ncbi:flagellar biosynthetic protein FliO [Bordetella sp. LUAb4]|uniref:flagellar biosynthetic protein FliO n=1 Tax=Bordetella sp. LUAb4 TaxID=2843195 RepID=UPI001E564D86|nr:flagellar biosynthetic protein FliO [Bordetella sp. LUAb4]
MTSPDVLRLFLGLVLVVGVILSFGWLARRGGLAGRARGHMRVVESLGLGPRHRMVLVQIDDTWLVVGVSAGQMNVLHTLPAGAALPDLPVAPVSAFAGKLGEAWRRRQG